MRDRRPIIKTKPNFAIVVDGDCEVWYLQMLKRNERSILVNIEPKIPQKKSVKEQLSMVKNLSEYYKKVFWIVDFDVILKETKEKQKGNTSPLQQFIDARNHLKKSYKNVVVIVNNPCLEYWLLLHFELTNKPFDNCELAEKQLKKSLVDYEKTEKYYTKQDHDIYLKLKPHLPKAIQNAKKIGIFSAENYSNSIAEMSLFFEELNL